MRRERFICFPASRNPKLIYWYFLIIFLPNIRVIFVDWHSSPSSGLMKQFIDLRCLFFNFVLFPPKSARRKCFSLFALCTAKFVYGTFPCCLLRDLLFSAGSTQICSFSALCLWPRSGDLLLFSPLCTTRHAIPTDSTAFKRKMWIFLDKVCRFEKSVNLSNECA